MYKMGHVSYGGHIKVSCSKSLSISGPEFEAGNNLLPSSDPATDKLCCYKRFSLLSTHAATLFGASVKSHVQILTI